MTNNDPENPQPPTPAASGEAPAPARKRAAKNAAATAAAPSPSAIKPAARKTARKAPAAHAAVVADVVAASSSNGPGEAASAAPTRKRKPSTAKPLESPAPTAADVVAASSSNDPAEAATSAPARNRKGISASAGEGSAQPDTAPQSDPENTAPRPSAAPAEAAPEAAPRRIGRVPGGGAVARSKSPRPGRKPKPADTDQAAAEAPAAAPPAEPTPVPAPVPASPQGVAETPAAPVAPPQHSHQPGGSGSESRSKRRREKRKQHRTQGQQNRDQGQNRHQGQHRHHAPNADANVNRQDAEANRPVVLTGPKVEANGLLELAPKSFGFLRVPKKNFEQARDDVFVPPELIRRHNLRPGQWLHGLYQDGSRGPQLVEITQINGLSPDEAAKLPHFDELKAINPTRRLSFETTPERFTTRVIDIMTPVGRGQRGLIVSPPRSGKTTMLLHTAEAVREKYSDSLHLMVLLVDERPEEVTEFRRALPGAEIYASSNDEVARNHCRIAELAIERAKRLVEAGKDVFLLMDSITRLARAYNATMNNVGRGTGSGGITIGALEVPRRLFAAARNTRGGGSLTILATALIQTNSRADEAIFLEFKGTGNMELVLDRKIAENYIYPAVDIFKSGTRREELLLPEHMLHKIHLIRRGLSGHRPVEAMERLLFFLKKFPNNPQMLLEIKG